MPAVRIAYSDDPNAAVPTRRCLSRATSGGTNAYFTQLAGLYCVPTTACAHPGTYKSPLLAFGRPGPMAIRLAILLVLAGVGLVAAAEGTRDGVFVGYKEAGVEGAADAAADSVDNLNVADGSGDGSLQAAADQEGTSGDVQAGKEADTVPGSGGDGAAGSQDAAAAADLTAVAGAVGRSVVLHTQFGPIKVKLLEQLAPRTTALVWDLAEKRGCRNCAFYRCVLGL